MSLLSRIVERPLRRAGYELAPRPDPARLQRSHPDLDDAGFGEAYVRCAAFTMTSVERMYALWQAIEHVHRHGVRGDVVECGVWRGGSSMLAALALARVGDHERELWLFDTFSGMPAPGDHDAALGGEPIKQRWHEHDGRLDDAVFAYGSLDEVQSNMRATGHPPARLHFVPGKVEDTLAGSGVGEIAVLRLDTDWYESTLAELEWGWPRLQANGVLIIDDYGHWVGARRAVDEFFAGRADAPLLTRSDYTGRLAVKLPPA